MASIGNILMLTISIALSSQSRQIIDDWQRAPQRVVKAINAGLTQVLFETESHIKQNKFGSPGSSRGGGQVGNRSGNLRQDITHEKTGLFSGHVGTTPRTAAYARTILGPDTTTITPKKAKHLWVPIADNLTRSGQMRMTPREAMSLTTPSGKRRLRVFMSKAGNLVAFLPEGGRYKRGAKKGQVKGKLLFVLKDQVTIQGTDALAEGVREMQPRMQAIFNQHLAEAFTPGPGS